MSTSISKVVLVCMTNCSQENFLLNRLVAHLTRYDSPLLHHGMFPFLLKEKMLSGYYRWKKYGRGISVCILTECLVQMFQISCPGLFSLFTSKEVEGNIQICCLAQNRLSRVSKYFHMLVFFVYRFAMSLLICPNYHKLHFHQIW